MTASGFNRFLKKNGLKPVPAEKLADLVYRQIKAYERRDRRETKKIVKELLQMVGFKVDKTEESLRTYFEILSNFGRLCDTVRTTLKIIEGGE